MVGEGDDGPPVAAGLPVGDEWADPDGDGLAGDGEGRVVPLGNGTEAVRPGTSASLVAARFDSGPPGKV